MPQAAASLAIDDHMHTACQFPHVKREWRKVGLRSKSGYLSITTSVDLVSAQFRTFCAGQKAPVKTEDLQGLPFTAFHGPLPLEDRTDVSNYRSDQEPFLSRWHPQASISIKHSVKLLRPMSRGEGFVLGRMYARVARSPRRPRHPQDRILDSLGHNVRPRRIWTVAVEAPQYIISVRGRAT
ncbi:hypothetical protein BOTBODRAFT_30825 [Botryobasidium botryosum FD-172 SS1]|uniref:Uncharacterized protein n=1 Tax=Botryobasidium botryosum (strain FD-172 SS1) TaxID=930990 RepID=A0A067MX77_BOTB1|nr:hypothetical protein BOTBODRAFT_30825 [Botryobasidium botryosum FD-172 SS1]